MTLPASPPDAPFRPAELYDDPGLGFARVVRPGDEPPPVPGVVDVAVLDMHHGFANLGHESIVDTLLEIARTERIRIGAGAPGLRVVSFDVRRRLAVPSDPRRYRLAVGTGGPGAIDPAENDGVSSGSQGVREDPSWEPGLFRYFDDVLADPSLHLLGICHTFGLLCRWSHVAVSILRGEAKGGKSTGVVGNVLTGAAREHPWFSELWRWSRAGRIDVLDSRLYDLVPTGNGHGLRLAFEAISGTASPGNAVTMIEMARDDDGVAPRVWGVNFHPEIGDRGLQRTRLDRLAARGEVTPEWVDERRRALDLWNASEAAERGLQRTSAFAFEGPLRRIVARLLSEGRGRAS